MRPEAGMTTLNRDFLTPTQRCDIMRRGLHAYIRPKLALATALRGRSVLFEMDPADIAGQPDIVIREKQLALFIDHGTGWGAPGLSALSEHRTKRGRSMAKFLRGCAHDLAQTAQLLADGWNVIRFWADDVERDTLGSVDLVFEAAAGKIATSPAAYLPP